MATDREMLMRVYALCEGAGGLYEDAVEAIMREVGGHLWPHYKQEEL